MDRINPAQSGWRVNRRENLNVQIYNQQIKLVNKKTSGKSEPSLRRYVRYIYIFTARMRMWYKS